jgi:hypothetical protein
MLLKFYLIRYQIQSITDLNNPLLLADCFARNEMDCTRLSNIPACNDVLLIQFLRKYTIMVLHISYRT